MSASKRVLICAAQAPFMPMPNIGTSTPKANAFSWLSSSPTTPTVAAPKEANTCTAREISIARLTGPGAVEPVRR